MQESSKTKKFIGNKLSRYLVGKGIDIGCGNDVICANAEPFDKIHGDANNILKYKLERDYDFVYSSHSLEHMQDPYKCIVEWFRLLKPGGHLIITVPDAKLYEQGMFPKGFNRDHKWMFTLDKNSEQDKLITIDSLIENLENANLISADLQDFNYDYSLKSEDARPFVIFLSKLLWRAISWAKKLKMCPMQKSLKKILSFLHKKLGIVLDQTFYFDAVAQIMVIIQKRIN